MIVQTGIDLKTKGFNHIVDITARIRRCVADSGLQDGSVLIFVPGATGGLTTIEYEPGLLQDFPEMLEKIAPMMSNYQHDATWHDGNGYAHLRSSLVGTSFTVPFQKGDLILGTWQQIIFIDFDNRSRTRRLHVQINGEE